MAKKIKNDDLVEVMCLVTGELVYVNPRTTETWKWAGYGDIQPIPFEELKYMKSGQPKFINQPWILILDETAVEALRLEKFYETIIKPNEMDNFLELPIEKMDELFEKAPSGMRLVIANYVKDKIDKKEFTDVFKIKYLEDKIGAELIQI